MKLGMITVMLAVLSFSTYAYNGNAYIESEFEEQANYILTAPNGWVQSYVAAKDQRVQTAFLPKHNDWESANARMYTNMEYMDQFETLEDIISFDLSNYQMTSPDLKVANGEPIVTADGSNAVVKHLLGTSYGTWEAIAYVHQGDKVVFVVLSADSKKVFDKNIGAFEQLVSSYHAPGLVIQD